jgi:hypothetical protein
MWQQVLHQLRPAAQQNNLLLCTFLRNRNQLQFKANTLVNEAVATGNDLREESVALSSLNNLGHRLASDFAAVAKQLQYFDAKVVFGKSPAVAGAGGQQQQQQQQQQEAGAAAALPEQCWRFQIILNPSGAPAPRWRSMTQFVVALPPEGPLIPRAVLVQPAAHPTYLDAGVLDFLTRGSSQADLEALLKTIIPASMLFLLGAVLPSVPQHSSSGGRSSGAAKDAGPGGVADPRPAGDPGAGPAAGSAMWFHVADQGGGSSSSQRHGGGGGTDAGERRSRRLRRPAAGLKVRHS